MNDEPHQHPSILESKSKPMTLIGQHRFIAMIAGSIVIALLLVAVAMALYASSGTAQLDLSRPGYKTVQNQVKQADNYEGFSATGSIDEKTLTEFKRVYDTQAKEVTSLDAFNPELLSDESLGIDAPIAVQ